VRCIPKKGTQCYEINVPETNSIQWILTWFYAVITRLFSVFTLNRQVILLTGIKILPGRAALIVPAGLRYAGIRVRDQWFSYHAFTGNIGISALEKTSFHSDDNPLAPALPPSGAGAHCDVSELPARKISARLCTGSTALSQPQMWRRGRGPQERHDYYQMISHENRHDACGHRHTG